MVARGVLARTIERLKGKADRIDILYICSNLAIARQNISRLNVTADDDFSLASRITLLPYLEKADFPAVSAYASQSGRDRISR